MMVLLTTQMMITSTRAVVEDLEPVTSPSLIFSFIFKLILIQLDIPRKALNLALKLSFMPSEGFHLGRTHF